MNEPGTDGQTGEDEDMICGLTADEHRTLASELQALPDTMPPREVWMRIREQAEAEGLVTTSPLRRHRGWLAGAGLAASVLLAVLLVPGLVDDAPEPQFSVVPQGELTNSVPLNALEALMVESRQLESELRSLPEEPRVVRLGTQATILELEDRISAIDYQLTDPEVTLTPEEEEIFWRERVRLMKSLVRLRYAQAQRTAF